MDAWVSGKTRRAQTFPAARRPGSAPRPCRRCAARHRSPAPGRYRSAAMRLPIRATVEGKVRPWPIPTTTATASNSVALGAEGSATSAAPIAIRPTAMVRTSAAPVAQPAAERTDEEMGRLLEGEEQPGRPHAVTGIERKDRQERLQRIDRSVDRELEGADEPQFAAAGGVPQARGDQRAGRGRGDRPARSWFRRSARTAQARTPRSSPGPRP